MHSPRPAGPQASFAALRPLFCALVSACHTDAGAPPDDPESADGSAALAVLGSYPSDSVEGTSTGGQLGWSVAGVGDMNGDGFGDLLAGQPFAGTSSSVRLWYGGPTGIDGAADWIWTENSPGREAGYAVTFAGDVNGDGRSDMAWSERNDLSGGTDAGAIYVVHGAVGPVSPTWHTRIVGAPGEHLGTRLASAGDVNNDGYSDVIVGLPDFGNGTGQARLYLGSATGLQTTPAWQLNGSQPGSMFGDAVASACDVNGDGFGDVVIGTSRWDNVQTDEGRASLYFGSASGLGTAAGWNVESNQNNAHMGEAVACAGDINADGRGDVAVGAPEWDVAANANEGRVTVYMSGATSLSTTAGWTGNGLLTNGEHGASIAVADPNGDGRPELFVGAPGATTDSNGLLVYWGLASGTFTSSPLSLLSSGGTRSGTSVTAAGDVDGDGIGDIATGRPLFDPSGNIDAGRVTIWEGGGTLPDPTPNLTLTTPGPTYGPGLYGAQVSGRGDVNGDGYGDLLVQESSTNSQCCNDHLGTTRLYLGSATGLGSTASWSRLGTLVDEGLSGVTMAGDTNGDGYDDFAFGMPNYTNGQIQEGRMAGFFGSPTGPGSAFDWQMESDTSYLNWGAGLQPVGDVNGDGYGDMAVMAIDWSGRIWLIPGSASGPVAPSVSAPTVTASNAWNIATFSAECDVNADGLWDLVVGAPTWTNGINTQEEGRVQILTGNGTSWNSTAFWTKEGNGQNYHWGSRVLLAGDVNGDGFCDWAGGDWLATWANRGRIEVKHGGTSVPFPTADATINGSTSEQLSYLGLGRAGDVNGDGYADIVMGGILAANGVRLYLGGSSGSPSNPDWTAPGASAMTPTGVGDLNGDGFDDLAVGFPNSNITQVFYGGSADGDGPPRGSTFQLRRANSSVPIRASNEIDELLFDLRGIGLRSILGRSRVAMQWQREYAGAAWTTDHEILTADVDSGLGGVSITSSSDVLTDNADLLEWDTSYQVRARRRVSPVHGHAELWGRWINPGLSGQPRGTHVRTGAIPDADADGDPDTSDCDDTNPAIYTGAAEVPDNGLDDDCDGVALVTCWADVDGDGSGAGPSSLVDAFLCVPPDEATTDGDCEPYDPAVHPGALELVGDGIDQDCSGADSVLCYPDLDGDGYGSGNATADVDGFCDAATNQSAVPGDCDDGNPALHPTATDLPDNGLDEDCTGAGLVTCYADADADYWGGPSTLDPDGSCTDDSGQWGVGGDCLDNDPMAHPGATDVPGNGVDEDCSGADSVLCFTDADGDGWGTGAASLDTDGVCAVASGQSGTGGDCNDAQALIHPFAAELADNGLDEDCSGADTVSCFQDVDGDGWGGLVSADPDGSCTDDPGQAGTPGDCDDLDAQTHPGATEVLSDGLDQDCTGADTALCWVDADGDGYGGASEQQDPDGSCLDDAGQTATPGDCADGNAAWNPAALDPPGDGLDQDCSGEDALSCWTDGDSDGWGVPPLVTDPDGDCTDDPGQADQGGDCDDLSLQRFPGNPEVADDGIDQDCSGWDDLTCYADQDGDGWGSSFTLVSPDGSCTDDPGEAPLGGDCEDQDPTVFPGATDIAGDGVDQDCSGLDSAACWADGDGDGVGGAVAQGDADGSCLDDPGQSALSGDCDDTDPTRFPGAPETPGDGIDQDCTFTDAALCFVDADGDGVGALLTTIEGDGDCDDDLGASSLSTDCDDADPTRWPGAPEFSFDGIDQDCDGADLLACLTDQDGDGWAGPTAIASSDQDCDDPGEFWTAADCDDASPFVNPGETDAPGNGVDEDCSGSDSVWCYEDIDGDGLGNVPVLSPDADCDDPLEGSTFGDCDDGNPFIGAGEAEICNGLDDDCDPATDEAADGDGDGVSACEGDCDDQDPARGPLAVEVCDGLDNDCEPGTDEGEDPDGDGFNLCEGDCAPFDPATSPVTAELCDGQDQDCDGAPLADEVDDDGDGVRLCEGDCDDLLPEVHPGATELCDGLDDDCDGFPGPAEEDTDQDGLTACEGDCGPGDPLVSPTQSERCDFVDTNCDGTLPPEELDADGDLWMPCTGDCDDGDAAAHPYAPEVAAGPDTNCDGLVGDADEDGDGSSVSEGDCDDADPEVHPGAAERCNGADDDCDGIFLAGERMDQDGDGSVDCLDCNALDPTIHPGATELCDGIDGDCDGYGIVPGEVDFDGDGAIPCMGDCDEGNPLVRQGIPEDCADGLDNDCDGTVDLNTDADQDGVGACDGDCQDTDSDVYPFAVEHCDGQDEDCDALVDEGFDADGDGHTTCGGDCDDSLPTVWPGAPAVCDDGLDNDCFPSTHEDVDLDGDGYVACGDPADCWEGNVRVSPLGLEVCNGLDDDCDGEIDGGIDTDGDGFSPCSFDCLEGDAQVNPRSPEVCGDGLDQDCDLLVDEDCEGDDDSAMADDDDSAGTPGVEDCGACAAAGGGAWGWAGLIVVLGLVLRRGASATRPAATRRG